MPLRPCVMDWKPRRILRVGKNSRPILSHLWTTVHKILGQCRGPFVLSKVIARLSMSCFVQKIFTTKSQSHRKTEQVFGPNFLWGMTPTSLWQIVSKIYCPPFGKVWLSSVCWSLSAKTGNEVECRIYGGWVKTPRHLWTQVHDILCGRLLVVSNSVAWLCIPHFVPKI